MYHIPIATHNRIVRGEVPILYMVISTHLGDRVYAKKGITVAAIAGSLGCLARVLSFGSFERTLSPAKDDILTSYGRKQQQHISVTLDNADKYFSIMLGKEPFLSRPIAIYIGFEDEGVANHIGIFQGIISEVSVLAVLTIEATEKSSESLSGLSLDDTFYLPRASRYSNALNTADLLPVVYGDLSDGTEGVWVMPCIDTVNYVYAYAAHPVLTAQTVNIYSAGALVDPANYTFNSSHYFEPEVPPPSVHATSDNIATITFTSDQGLNLVTARGKGKIHFPITLAGEQLIDNLIDIIDDFLTIQNDFASTFLESNKKALARNLFEDCAYIVSGVIHKDGTFWDIITSMMSTFLGSAYLNGAGELCLEIDNGTISQFSAGTPTAIPKQESTMTEANLRLVNVVNRCPVNYAYDYIYGRFKRGTDTAAHSDGISQGIYGLRKPNTPHQAYWSRDLTTVQAVQDVIVGKFNAPLYEIEIEDITLKRIHVDVGDAVLYSADTLYDDEGNALNNALWRIISVRPDFEAGKIIFRALQVFFRSAVPSAESPWDGILSLTALAIPDAPVVGTSKIEEAKVAADAIVIAVPDIAAVSVSTIVHTVVATCTISQASPGVVTCAGHGQVDGKSVIIYTTGVLPAPLVAGRQYYVKNSDLNTFNVALTPAGSTIDTTSAGSGTHTLWAEI
jgi:hypothetical protein